MSRREFLTKGGAVVSALSLPSWAQSGAMPYQRTLILVELKGANDGLNTLVPYADAAYYDLRPRVQINRDQVLKLDERVGLHPALAALMPLWQDQRLAVLQGLGYPKPNLSHFRSIEIWDSASKSDEYLQQGWLARAFANAPPPSAFAADGAIVGAVELGPLVGAARAINVQSTEGFLRAARLADPHGRAHNRALQHLLKVETDVRQAASSIKPATFKTEFPKHPFGEAARTALQLVAASGGVAAVRISLGSFDTHQNQLGTHNTLLTQLAEGLGALQKGLAETGRWNDSLILSYCEFGRRAKENLSGGTDHGTANVQFALGGAVKGGLYGAMPSLTQLSGDGNLIHTTDFRSVYSTVLTRWWGQSAAQTAQVLGGEFAPLSFV